MPIQHYSAAAASTVSEFQHEGIVVLDASGTVREFSPRAEQIFGYRADEVLGQNLTRLMPDNTDALPAHRMGEYLAGGDDSTIRFARRVEAVRKDGTRIALAVAVDEMWAYDERRFTAVIRDLSEQSGDDDYRQRLECMLAERTAQLVRVRDQLARQERIDRLTGVANRAYFDEYLAREWARAERDGTTLGLLLMELDAFGAYREGYGSAAAEQCMRRVARCIDNAFRRGADLFARFEGATFALVLPGADIEQLRVNAERLIGAVRDMGIAHRYSLVDTRVTLSVGGVSLQPSLGGSVAMLLEDAAQCVDQVQRDGCNSFYLTEE